MKIALVSFAVFLALGVGMYVGTNQACGEECAAGEGASMETVAAAEFRQILETEEVQLIDIRTAEEYAEGHIVGAIQNDFYQTTQFNEFLNGLDKDQQYLIYCRSGNRSGQALKLMEQKGFAKVANLDGGIQAWQAAGYDLEK